MGAIERIAAVWKANLNEVLDRIEDPVKMADQTVRDAEGAVDQAVAALVKARATKQRLERDLQRNELWRAKAAAAVEAGNDEGARLALIQKTELEQAHVRLESALAESCDTVAELAEQVELLRQKLRNIRARRGKLIACCCTEREAAPALRFDAIAQRVQQSERELARFEQQVDQAVAEAEVLRELVTERDRKVAEELAALKAEKAS